MDIVGRSGYIAGWGKISQEHGHTGTNILRTAQVPIICEYLQMCHIVSQILKYRQNIWLLSSPWLCDTVWTEETMIEWKYRKRFLNFNSNSFSSSTAKSECIRWHKKKNIHVELFDEMICAGYKNKTVDACLGDRWVIFDEPDLNEAVKFEKFESHFYSAEVHCQRWRMADIICLV